MITICEEQHQDIHAIREVNIQAFGQNQEADLVDKIRKSSNDLISLVAVAQNTIVGHIFFSPVTIESKAKKQSGEWGSPQWQYCLPTRDKELALNWFETALRE